jgi:hypothetical protein
MVEIILLWTNVQWLGAACVLPNIYLVASNGFRGSQFIAFFFMWCWRIGYGCIRGVVDIRLVTHTGNLVFDCIVCWLPTHVDALSVNVAFWLCGARSYPFLGPSSGLSSLTTALAISMSQEVWPDTVCFFLSIVSRMKQLTLKVGVALWHPTI